MPARNEDLVVALDDDVDESAESRSHAHTNEHQTTLARVEAPELDEYDGEHGEESVEEAVAARRRKSARKRALTHQTHMMER